MGSFLWVLQELCASSQLEPRPALPLIQFPCKRESQNLENICLKLVARGNSFRLFFANEADSCASTKRAGHSLLLKFSQSRFEAARSIAAQLLSNRLISAEEVTAASVNGSTT